MATSLATGDIVNVLTDGALTSAGSLLTAGFDGEIIATTEKAVRLCGKTESGAEIDAWFPRKAFVKLADRGALGNQRMVGAALARWFRPTGWTARFVALTTTSSIMVAA